MRRVVLGPTPAILLFAFGQVGALLVGCGGIAVDGDGVSGSGGSSWGFVGGAGGTLLGVGGLWASGGLSSSGGGSTGDGASSTGGGLGIVEASIFPPDSTPYGASHPEWLARYWQWFLAIPKSIHPREGGACAEGQASDVWFLTTGRNQQIEVRDCVIPAGVPLFIAGTATISFPKPDCWDCVHEAAASPEAWLDAFPDSMLASRSAISPSRISLEIDDVPFPVGDDYLWMSEVPFFADVPEGDPYFDCSGTISENECGWPIGLTRPFGSAGYAIMIHPLSPGSHTIRFGASRQSGWQTDVTYNLWIE